METKQYVIALTKDYVEGFVMGAISIAVICIYKNRKKSKREEA